MPTDRGMFSYCRHIPNCWDSVTEHAIGTHGTADLSAGRIRVKGWDDWRFRGEKKNPYQVEHDDLFASIRAGSPLNEAENGAVEPNVDFGTHDDLLGQDDHLGAGARLGHQPGTEGIRLDRLAPDAGRCHAGCDASRLRTLHRKLKTAGCQSIGVPRFFFASSVR